MSVKIQHTNSGGLSNIQAFSQAVITQGNENILADETL